MGAEHRALRAARAAPSDPTERSRRQVFARIRDEGARSASLAAATCSREKDLANGIEPPHACDRDTPGFEIRLDRETGDERHTVAGEHGAARRLLESELEPDVEVAQPRSRLPQLVLDHVPHSGPLLHDDQLFGLQLLERDRLSRKAVGGRTGEHDLVAEERLEDDAAVAPPCAHDPELELPVGDAIDNRLRVGNREADAQLGVPLGELAEEERDDGAAWAGRSAEFERAGEGALVDLRDLLEQALLQRQQPLSRRVEAKACLGGLDAASGAVQQPAPEALLERSDLEADGRLCHAQPLGGLRKALALDDGAEGGQLTRV